jgi:hypothetical protein
VEFPSKGVIMTKFNRHIITMSTSALLVLMTHGSLAHGNDRGDAKATIGGAHVSIDYGRPSLKGRDPLKMIQPGKVWRLGSDAPTTLESDRDLNVGGTIVPKGKHILLARYVESGKWTLVFSKKPAFQFEPSAQIPEVPLKFEETNDPVEMVTIQVSERGGSGIIEIAWGKMRLSASFRVAK